MIDAGCSAGLVEEPFHIARVVAAIRAQDLDGRFPSYAAMLGKKHFTHAAFSDLFSDDIVAELLPKHCVFLPPEKTMVNRSAGDRDAALLNVTAT